MLVYQVVDPLIMISILWLASECVWTIFVTVCGELRFIPVFIHDPDSHNLKPLLYYFNAIYYFSEDVI